MSTMCTSCYTGNRSTRRWRLSARLFFTLAVMQAAMGVIVGITGGRQAEGLAIGVLLSSVPLVALALVCGRKTVCQDCGAEAVIPLNSPRGQQILKSQQG